MNGERVFSAIIRGVKVYWYIATIFFGGLAAAMLSRFFVGFLPQSWPPGRVSHIAWIAGALIVAIGTPLGWVKIPSPGTTSGKFWPAKSAEQPPPVTIDRSFGNAMRTGRTMAIMGAFLGFLLGGTLVAIWYSIAVGPFAPKEWANSFAMRQQGPGKPSRMVTTSTVPAIAWLGSIGGLALAGFIFGATGASRGWVADKSG